MSTKSRKKHKGAGYSESKPNNEGTEVFVLPPNLLEKLGIKLDNILSAGNNLGHSSLTADLADKSLQNNQHNVEDCFKTPKVVNKKNESSILETASLMKESVFLSPTFVPTVANVIPGELEFIQSYGHTKRFNANNQSEIENLYGPDDNINLKQNESLGINPNKVPNIITNVNGINSIKTSENNITSISNESESSKKIDDIVIHLTPEENINVNISLPGEIKNYSDSNNLQKVHKCQNSETRNLNQKIGEKKKITVIHEEVVKVSNIYKRTSLCPNLNNNVLTPVSVDMLLPTVKKETNSLDINNVEQTDVADKVVSLLHDIGRTGTDIRQSCNFVVDDVVKHVDVINVNNETDKCNSINKSSLMNVLPNINSNNKVGFGLTELNEVSYEVKNNLQNTVHENGSVCEDNVIKVDNFEEYESDIYSTDTIDAIAKIQMNGIENKDMSIDKCKIVETDIISNAQLDTDNISSEMIDQSNFETLDKVQIECSENELLNSFTHETICKESSDLVSSLEAYMNGDKYDEESIYHINENNCDENGFIYADEQMCMDNEKETNNAKAGLRKSKLCIQGVEKPGGDKNDVNVMKIVCTETIDNAIFPKDQEETMNEPEPSQSNLEQKQCRSETKILKTYKRQNIPVKKPLDMTEFSDLVEIANDLIDTKNEHENHTIALDSVCKTVDFCLCGDFGQLKCYDSHSSYEHIHFWKHNHATSDRDLIFSMYDDDKTFDYDEIDLCLKSISENPEDILSGTETSEECYINICWNEINADIKNKSINDNNLNELDLKEKKQDVIEPSQLKSDTSEYDTTDGINLSCGIINVAVSRGDEHLEISVPMEVTKQEPEIKERNDNVYNNCLEFTETNKSLELTDKDKINESESTDIQTQSTDMTCNSKKRKASLTADITEDSCSKDVEEPPCKKDVKCGVCDQVLALSEWDTHCSQVHGLIAWKAGETFDFGDKSLLGKLKQKLKRDGVLICSFCKTDMKAPKRYVSHMQECSKKKFEPRPARQRRSSIKESVGKLVNCGVCKTDIKSKDWLDHICEKHNYLAWKTGQPPLNLDNVQIVEQHLKSIIKVHGPIICSRCGFDRKYTRKAVKSYLEHLKICDKTFHMILKEETTHGAAVERNELTPDTPMCDEGVIVKCGVCEQDVAEATWISHIMKEHNYLAWKEGEKSLDLSNDEGVKSHLYNINKVYDGLICSKCGIKRKYVKKFLSHIKACDGSEVKVEEEAPTEQKENDISICEESANVKCGVCEQEVTGAGWICHIMKEHNYLAWKEGENPLDLSNDEEVKSHLYNINKKYEGLICSKCGIKRKYVKKFLSHINDCDGTESIDDSLLTTSMNESFMSNICNTSQRYESTVPASDEVKCGVCYQNIKSSDWFDHIGKEHNHIAWKDGEKPLDMGRKAIILHLSGIMKERGYLFCPECGLTHKAEETTAKEYMMHVSYCRKKLQVPEKKVVTVFREKKKVVKCGVCEKEMLREHWVKHIEESHNYIAWKEGDTPLVLDDPECIRLHLFTLINRVGAFKCSNCGVLKKYPKSFLTHLETCLNGDITENGTGPCVCAVCSETVESKDWIDHAMERHYNIAWKVGEAPIDLKSTYGTEKHLKLYKQYKGKLVCKNCGASRVSIVGFYAHIVACGKTEEELEEYKNFCDICNSKYLCIYKNQHMAFHREQELAKERKLIAAEKKIAAPTPPPPTGGRRKAALRANDVIEKLNSSNEFIHTCPTCGFDTDCKKKFLRHKCATNGFEQNSGSESESEDTDGSIDPDLSAEEELQDAQRRRKNKESIVQAKIPDVPFKYKKDQSVEDYFKVHFTDEMLFPQWSVGEFELVSEDQMKEYLPAVEKSCQLRNEVEKEWITFDRFEAKKSNKGHTIFVGASVQCIEWAPPRMNDEDRNYLAVSCHRGSDSPRFNYDEVATHPGLIQIWDFGEFKNDVPILVMGLAHDLGTVWAMDWCPSGARDIVTNEEQKPARLGMLALACSSGCVYIMSVPHPQTLAESGSYIKLKPVAELRLAMGTDRKIYQATAITWSKQKGHDFVAVGYSDGTVAFYDLRNASPLLQCTENGISVFYPYHDERQHNICITALDSLAVGSGTDSTVGPGAVSSASQGGAAALVRPGAATTRLRAHAVATGCSFAPGWPAAMVAIEDSIASQGAAEMEWYGCGRRLGPMRRGRGCARCGRALLHAPPALRLVTPTPPYADLRKQNILVIRAQPLTKMSRRTNDELAMKVEPLTYDEVISQYGIEMFFVEPNDKNNSINTMKEPWTERFPLPDVSSIAFCPSAAHHQKVAIGVHAGFVILFTL